MNVVWFKRDLRVDDHKPLVEACRRGSVLPVYLDEPDGWAQPDMARRHREFVAEAIADLDGELRRCGQGLLVLRGPALESLNRLRDRFGMRALFAHQETGNGWSFRRDQRVRGWCRDVSVKFHEFPQFGVVRGLRDRKGWAAGWERFMRESPEAAPNRLTAVCETPPARAVFELESECAGAPCPDRQHGGLREATRILDDFLSARGRAYRGGISSPLSAPTACSRLSPHLAWGCVSLRRVVQQARARARQARETGEPRWTASLSQFDRRLHWHCHFIQKLEQRPEIEFENVHRGFDGMREPDFDRARFEAWCDGQTGYPLVDACMRALLHTGWINFRMRAMLMSFAAYPMWLHWREPALHLARLFTDYEPGIHYSQCQMQSGTTGINTLRIYNPVKQAREHDPDGEFVRRWVPELEGVTGGAIFEPWTLGAIERRRIGAGNYPSPIVDHADAAREAKARVTEFRRRPGFRSEADRIQHQLGSRRGGLRESGRSRRKSRDLDRRQGSLF